MRQHLKKLGYGFAPILTCKIEKKGLVFVRNYKDSVVKICEFLQCCWVVTRKNLDFKDHFPAFRHIMLQNGKDAKGLHQDRFGKTIPQVGFD